MAASDGFEFAVVRLRFDPLMRERLIIPARYVLATLILLVLVTLYVVMKNNSWAFDDNLFLALAGQEGFTWHWLDSVQFEHWDIGEHAVISLQHWLFYFDYRWALVVMLGMLGSSMYLLERTLAMIVDRRWVAIVASVWFGLNVVWVAPLQWWAVGVQCIPSTFFDLFCLYGFMRYQAGGGRHWIAVSAAALAAALLFFEKPAYMLGYLVLIRVLLLSGDLKPRSVLRSFWSERWMWAGYVAVIAIWAFGYIHSQAYTYDQDVTFTQYLTYFRIMWLEALVPALVGITVPAANLDAIQTAFVVVTQIAFAACVVLSIMRKRSAWRAWAFLAIVVLVDGLLIAHSRVTGFGVGTGHELRYLIDFAWIVPLTVCAAFARNRISRPVLPRRPELLRLPARPLVPVTVCVLLLAYAGVTVASAAKLQHNWAGPQARQWATRVRSGIASLRRSGVRFVVANNITPFVILAEWTAPYDRLSRILPLYVGPVQIDGPLNGELVRVAEDGAVHRVEPDTIGNGNALDLVGSHRMNFGAGGHELSYGGDECVVASGTPVSVERKLTEIPSSAASPYYLLLSYRVWQSSDLPLTVDTGNGYPATPYYEVNVGPGSGVSLAWLGPAPPLRVSMVVPPMETVCVNRFDIVSLRDIS